MRLHLLCLTLLLGLPLGQALASTCVLVADAATGRVLVQEGDCEGPQSPCSTFKVPLALMGFEAGLLEGPEAPKWSFQEGNPVNTPFDKLDTDPRAWLKNSVVWYSQRLTRALGLEAFKGFVEAFNYGNRDLSGNPGAADGLTRAWLSSSLLVTPAQQVEFLGRLLAGKLPVKPRTRELLFQTMPEFQSDGWRVLGKTGSCKRRGPQGYDEKRAVGWFVGWASKADRRLIFVYRLLDETPSLLPAGPRAREALLKGWGRWAEAPATFP